jgi:hypothetical protein
MDKFEVDMSYYVVKFAAKYGNGNQVRLTTGITQIRCVTAISHTQVQPCY